MPLRHKQNSSGGINSISPRSAAAPATKNNRREFSKLIWQLLRPSGTSTMPHSPAALPRSTIRIMSTSRSITNRCGWPAQGEPKYDD